MMKECANHCSIMQWSRYGFPVDTASQHCTIHTHTLREKRQCHPTKSMQCVIMAYFSNCDANGKS